MHELALHVLDLVQNSLEAQATSVWLEVSENTAADLLTIRVMDNGRGMDEWAAANATDPFSTSRTTRKVGLGLPLMDMTARQADGYLTIDSKPGKGTIVEAVYRLSHWDRPPLGNIADTVRTIIVANPELDFHYSHSVGQTVFSVSTQELKEILGEIPLTHPDVLVWLQSYLKENTANLYGGVQE